MSLDNRTKIFYEDNKSEILDRQLEQYHHNEKIALRFIVGLGVTAGLSTFSSFISLLMGNQKIAELIDSFWNSGVQSSGQSNVLIGTMFLIVSVFLFVFALGKFWKVLNMPNPIPLLGNRSFSSKDIDLQVDEYNTEYRLYLSKNSQLLFRQSQMIDAGHSLSTVGVLSLILGLLYILSGKTLSAMDIGRLNFQLSYMAIFALSFVVTLYVSKFLHKLPADEPRYEIPKSDRINSELLSVLPFGFLLLIIVIPSILLILISAIRWWVTFGPLIENPIYSIFRNFGVIQTSTVGGIIFGAIYVLSVRLLTQVSRNLIDRLPRVK